MFAFLRELVKGKKMPSASQADLSVFFLDEPQRYVRFKHACIGDYSFHEIDPGATLSGCSCGDFRKFGFPCHHMYKVALDSGVYDNLFCGHEELIARIETLSPSAFAMFGEALYGGYYEGTHSLKFLKRYKTPIVESGLVEVVSEKEYVYSESVRENLYFVIHYVMSDDRFREKRFTKEAWAEIKGFDKR